MSQKTQRLRWNPADPEGGSAAIVEAAAILRAGGTVAMPTETVYGLGANALDEDAVARIFAAKGRPAWDPLIVHLADRAMLAMVAVQIPRAAEAWMNAFWPGPLTLLLPRAPGLPHAVTAGTERVGVRMPAHPAAQALLLAASVPVAAPSANRFGHVSPTTADHVLADLDGRIDAVLDAGPCVHGVESTVLDATVAPALIYRPGVVTLEQLQGVVPGVALHIAGARAEGDAAASPSPGVGIRHYAPAAELRLIEHGPDQAGRLAQAVAAQAESRLGVLLPAGFLPAPAARAGLVIYNWGEWAKPETLAHSLFDGLRFLDAAGVEAIVCPLPEATGLGAAVCDRLRKAAMKR